MVPITPFALALLAACGQGYAPSNDLSAIDPALARVQRDVWDVWFAGDTTKLKELLSPDLIAINNTGGSFADLRREIDAAARFRERGGRLLDLQFPDRRVQQFGDVVLVYSVYQLTLLTGADTTREAGRVTEVFVKRDGRWLHPAWHMDSGK